VLAVLILGTTRAVLELVDLSRRYGETVALDGFSLRAQEGKLLGFVGPNGAGKSTAMRIALGVLEPDGGGGALAGAACTA
jgi:ABC-2 type transport system ATP-binding protein